MNTEAMAAEAARIWKRVTDELGLDAALAGADGLTVEWLDNGKPMLTAGARAYCETPEGDLTAAEMIDGTPMVGLVEDGQIRWLV